MPIATKCPGCKAVFRLADELAGKKVRCQKCKQLFAVPLPKAAPAAEPPKPEAPAPAPTPPISLSLDDPLPAILLEKPAPAPVVVAVPVEAPKPPEVIDAVLLKAAKPAEEIFDATIVDDPPAKPAPSREPPPRRSKPKPAPERARRAADLPQHRTGRSVALAFLGFFLIGFVLIAGFVGAAVLLNMNRGEQRVAVPPAKKFDFGDAAKEKFNDGIVKKQGVDQLLPLDAEGRANAAGNIPPGGEAIYRISVEQNQRYHVLVSSNDVAPDVTAREGGALVPAVANKGGGGRVLLALAPQRTGEHEIHIYSRVPFQGGAFTLRVTRVIPTESIPIDLGAKGEFRAEGTLLLEDPAFSADLGPCQTYLMNVKPGQKLHFKVTAADFQAALRIRQGDNITGPSLTVDLDKVGYDYTVPNNVAAITACVTSPVYGQRNMLGKYTLQVTRILGADEPGPRTVVFNPDAYRRDDLLTANDPNEAELGHAKTYFVPMEKGLGYNIDMKSKELSAHLTLFGPDGNLVAKDDDSGGNFNARILFDPAVSGEYRLVATDVKKGTGAFTIEIARFKLPESAPGQNTLKAVNRQEAGCEIIQANWGPFAAVDMASRSNFAWSPDGRAFFIADRSGKLHRYRYPEFVEDRQLLTTPAEIHLTGEGLLASIQASSELWVIDPVDLRLKRRLPRVGTGNILASPALPYVYVAATFNMRDGSQAPGLIRHDLTAPRMLSFQFAKAPLSTQFLAITPDGRLLLGSDGERRLVRWKVVDDKIFTGETGTRPFQGPLIVSADGKLLLCTMDNPPPPASGFGIAGYRVTDFKEPMFVVESGAPSAAAAIDPKNGMICVHTKTKGFLLADAQGKIVRELDISGVPAKKKAKKDGPERLAFHPDGGKLLVISSGGVMSIELPRDLPPKSEEKEK